jgi:hypothetical protein
MEGLEKYADVEIVKSLRGAGFSDQYILGMIESGGIDIEKAMACDKKEVMKETKKEEEIEKGKKLEKSDEPEKKEEDKEEEKEEVMKSVVEAITKGFEAISSKIDARFEGIEKSVHGQETLLKSIGDQAPAFRAPVSAAALLQKSMETDEKGKMEVNIVSQRPLARQILSDAISREKNEDIKKSMIDDTKNFLTNPDCHMIGESTARLMYERGVKFTN